MLEQVPQCDAELDPECEADEDHAKWLIMHRSRYPSHTGQGPNNPRQQLNSLTPWIDGGVIYGNRRGVSDALRSFRGGELIVQTINGEEYPPFNTPGLPAENPAPPTLNRLLSPARFFRSGNAAQNENPMLLSVNLVFFRNHNYHARRLAALNPTWTDERLFHRARQWVIAEQQRLIAYEFVPAFVGEALPDYHGYEPAVSPAISQTFHVAAMRFGHSLVPPGVYRRSATCNFHTTTNVTGTPGNIAFRTCNSFFLPNEPILEFGLNDILMGLASQIAEREDRFIVEDLRGFVQGPLEQTRRDLMVQTLITRESEEGERDEFLSIFPGP